MRYLVTGGAGFIGSHLVDRLLRDGNEVIVIDDFSEGKWENLQVNHSNLIVYKKSILGKIEKLFKGVSVVFHLAALTRPQLSIAEPEPSNLVNVSGTLNVLLNSRDKKVERVVFASSASIYGEQEKYPSSEIDKPNPMSPYASQKLMGEQYCQLFTKIYGLETNCLRLFNVYGKRMNPDGEYASLFPKFIKLIRNGIRPTINGTGKQTRDFVYIDDVVESMILASKSKAFGEVFNVGSGESLSVNDAFNIICWKLGKKIEPIYGPAVIEPTQVIADIKKINDVLGWKQEVDLGEGLDIMIRG